MRPHPLQVAVWACALLPAFGAVPVVRAVAQPPAQPVRVEPSLTVTCETFCSATKVRTTNARVRWSVPGPALEAMNLTSLAAARQSLEVTVHKKGFETGLSITLPISPATPSRPVLPLTQPTAAAKVQPRAFQIRLIQIEQPRLLSTATTETAVVVEDLEPGVNYLWRVALETTSGRIVSPSARCQARICPADLIETVPRRRP